MKTPPTPEDRYLRTAAAVPTERDRAFLVFAGVVLVAIALGFKSELLAQGQVWALALGLVVVAAPALLGYLRGTAEFPRIEHYIPVALGAVTLAGLSILVPELWKYLAFAATFGAGFVLQLPNQRDNDRASPRVHLCPLRRPGRHVPGLGDHRFVELAGGQRGTLRGHAPVRLVHQPRAGPSHRRGQLHAQRDPRVRGLRSCTDLSIRLELPPPGAVTTFLDRLSGRPRTRGALCPCRSSRSSRSRARSRGAQPPAPCVRSAPRAALASPAS